MGSWQVGMAKGGLVMRGPSNIDGGAMGIDGGDSVALQTCTHTVPCGCNG